MFSQMFQFRLGGKTITVSCKGHKEEASACVASTKRCRTALLWPETAQGCAVQGGAFTVHPDATLLTRCQSHRVRHHSARGTLDEARGTDKNVTSWCTTTGEENDFDGRNIYS